MNPLAEMWAHRRLEQFHRAELRRLAEEVRESNASMAPLIAEANARRKANMRQDGPQGFVMVQK
ncbi:MAG: hypothetical protein ACRC14_02635 [Paracoccaceae bacterium]